MQRWDNKDYWINATLWSKFKLFAFAGGINSAYYFVYAVYIMASVASYVCESVDVVIEVNYNANNYWFLDSNLYNSTFLSELSLWYNAVAVRFVGCIIGAMLAVWEYESPLSLTDIDFATPQDDFI